MKTLSIPAILALSIGLLSAATADAATASSPASADLVPAIAITNTVPLEFGQIVPSATIGTVTVPTAGNRAISGGVTLANGIVATPSSFDVTGSADSTYAITLPTSITLLGVGPPMVVDGFVSDPSGNGLLSPQGTQTFPVGATLHVGVNQPAGEYTGTFDVNIAYN